jgi:hypothetical protein
MVDQREALAVTTELTDTVYLVRPAGIQNHLDQKAAILHFTTMLSGTLVKVRDGHTPVTKSQKPS